MTHIGYLFFFQAFEWINEKKGSFHFLENSQWGLKYDLDFQRDFQMFFWTIRPSKSGLLICIVNPYSGELKPMLDIIPDKVGLFY